MSVDPERAKKYLEDKPLTLQQIKAIRAVLNSRGASWLVQRQSGRLSKEDRDNLLAFLKQEEERLRERS